MSLSDRTDDDGALASPATSAGGSVSALSSATLASLPDATSSGSRLGPRRMSTQSDASDGTQYFDSTQFEDAVDATAAPGGIGSATTASTVRALAAQQIADAEAAASTGGGMADHGGGDAGLHRAPSAQWANPRDGAGAERTPDFKHDSHRSSRRRRTHGGGEGSEGADAGGTHGDGSSRHGSSRPHSSRRHRRSDLADARGDAAAVDDEALFPRHSQSMGNLHTHAGASASLVRRNTDDSAEPGTTPAEGTSLVARNAIAATGGYDDGATSTPERDGTPGSKAPSRKPSELRGKDMRKPTGRTKSPASSKTPGRKRQLLRFTPDDEIMFALEPSEAAESSLLMEAPSSTPGMMAFKIKTTAPDRYLVTPSMGMLEAGTSVCVSVVVSADEASAIYDKMFSRGGGKEAAPVGDKFLIQSVLVDPSDLSTEDNVRDLAKLWSSSRWKKKVRNKKMPVKYHRKVMVSSDDDDDDDDVGAAAATVGRSGSGSGGSGSGVATAYRSVDAERAPAQASAPAPAPAPAGSGSGRGASGAATANGSGRRRPVVQAGTSAMVGARARMPIRGAGDSGSSAGEDASGGRGDAGGGVRDRASSASAVDPRTRARSVSSDGGAGGVGELANAAAAAASASAAASRRTNGSRRSSGGATSRRDSAGSHDPLSAVSPTSSIGGGGAEVLPLSHQGHMKHIHAPMSPMGSRPGSRGGALAGMGSPVPSPRPVFRWRQGEVVGTGQSGRVYKALREDSGKVMAVKVIEVPSAREQAQLEREIAVMRLLNHPNVIRYLGTEAANAKEAAGVSAHGDPVVRVFMEFAPGGSIAEVLKRFGPLEEHVVRVYTKQILRGLRYLHEHGIAHRDVKGGNILVAANGTIKLADFGASKATLGPHGHGGGALADAPPEVLAVLRKAGAHKGGGGDGRGGDASAADSGGGGGGSTGGGDADDGDLPSPREQGTPQWMAPEVVTGEVAGRAWQQADVWSVGCTVIEMLTGVPPWPDLSNPLAIMVKIAQADAQPAIPASVSAEGRDFLAQCLTRDPARRPDTEKLLHHPFVAVPISSDYGAAGVPPGSAGAVSGSGGARRRGSHRSRRKSASSHGGKSDKDSGAEGPGSVKGSGSRRSSAHSTGSGGRSGGDAGGSASRPSSARSHDSASSARRRQRRRHQLHHAPQPSPGGSDEDAGLDGDDELPSPSTAARRERRRRAKTPSVDSDNGEPSVANGAARDPAAPPDEESAPSPRGATEGKRARAARLSAKFHEDDATAAASGTPPLASGRRRRTSLGTHDAMATPAATDVSGGAKAGGANAAASASSRGQSRPSSARTRINEQLALAREIEASDAAHPGLVSPQRVGRRVTEGFVFGSSAVGSDSDGGDVDSGAAGGGDGGGGNADGKNDEAGDPSDDAGAGTLVDADTDPAALAAAAAATAGKSTASRLRHVRTMSGGGAASSGTGSGTGGNGGSRAHSIKAGTGRMAAKAMKRSATIDPAALRAKTAGAGGDAGSDGEGSALTLAVPRLSLTRRMTGLHVIGEIESMLPRLYVLVASMYPPPQQWPWEDPVELITTVAPQLPRPLPGTLSVTLANTGMVDWTSLAAAAALKRLVATHESVSEVLEQWGMELDPEESPSSSPHGTWGGGGGGPGVGAGASTAGSPTAPPRQKRGGTVATTAWGSEQHLGGQSGSQRHGRGVSVASTSSFDLADAKVEDDGADSDDDDGSDDDVMVPMALPLHTIGIGLWWLGSARERLRLRKKDKAALHEGDGARRRRSSTGSSESRAAAGGSDGRGGGGGGKHDAEDVVVDANEAAVAATDDDGDVPAARDYTEAEIADLWFREGCGRSDSLAAVGAHVTQLRVHVREVKAAHTCVSTLDRLYKQVSRAFDAAEAAHLKTLHHMWIKDGGDSAAGAQAVEGDVRGTSERKGGGDDGGGDDDGVGGALATGTRGAAAALGDPDDETDALSHQFREAQRRARRQSAQIALENVVLQREEAAQRHSAFQTVWRTAAESAVHLRARQLDVLAVALDDAATAEVNRDGLEGWDVKRWVPSARRPSAASAAGDALPSARSGGEAGVVPLASARSDTTGHSTSAGAGGESEVEIVQDGVSDVGSEAASDDAAPAAAAGGSWSRRNSWSAREAAEYAAQGWVWDGHQWNYTGADGVDASAEDSGQWGEVREADVSADYQYGQQLAQHGFGFTAGAPDETHSVSSDGDGSYAGGLHTQGHLHADGSAVPSPSAYSSDEGGTPVGGTPAYAGVPGADAAGYAESPTTASGDDAAGDPALEPLDASDLGSTGASQLSEHIGVAGAADGSGADAGVDEGGTGAEADASGAYASGVYDASASGSYDSSMSYDASYSQSGSGASAWASWSGEGGGAHNAAVYGDYAEFGEYGRQSAGAYAAEATGPVDVSDQNLHVRALADYTAQDENELTLYENDTVTVLRKDPSGWWEGEISGRVGWFPSNFVHVKYDLYRIEEETEADLLSPRSDSEGADDGKDGDRDGKHTESKGDSDAGDADVGATSGGAEDAAEPKPDWYASDAVLHYDPSAYETVGGGEAGGTDEHNTAGASDLYAYGGGYGDGGGGGAAEGGGASEGAAAASATWGSSTEAGGDAGAYSAGAGADTVS